MPTEIKFGTDGWRGIIADDYTFENVRRVAGAIAAYVLKNEEPAHGIVIGYDTRFGSHRFAEACAEVLAQAGIPLSLATDYSPPPPLSYAVKHLGPASRILSASTHTPWTWTGRRFQ